MKCADDITQVSQGEQATLKRFVVDENGKSQAVNGLNIQAVFKTCTGYLVKKLEGAAVAQISTIQTVADIGGNLAGKFFFYDTPANKYVVWIESGGNGSAPSVSGRTAVQVTIAQNASANDVATALQASMDALADVSSAVASNTVTNTNTASGEASEPLDSTGATSAGFIFAVTTKGRDLVEDSISVDTDNCTICIVLTKEDTKLLAPDARVDFWVVIDFAAPSGRKFFANFNQLEVVQVGFNDLLD